MKKNIKKTSLFFILTLVIALGFFNSTSLAISTKNNSEKIANEIDLLSIIEDSSKVPEDAEVKGPFTFYELAKEMATIEDISINEAIDRLSSENGKFQTMGTADYYTYNQSVTVTSSYKPKVVFYCKVIREDFRPVGILKVLNASLNRSYNGTSKQFSGKLYYNLQSISKLYYELNGDFYNNGKTTVSGGASIGIGQKSSIKFNISNSSRHYKYCYKNGIIYGNSR